VAAVASDLEKVSGTDTGHALAKSTVDPADEPSAEWGWHGSLRKGTLLWLTFVAVISFLLFIGNQIGHVEDFYLAITGVVAIILLIRNVTKRRNPWNR
jgi:hypothetical protein